LSIFTAIRTYWIIIPHLLFKINSCRSLIREHFKKFKSTYVIAFPISDTKAKTLLPAIYDNVEKNATVYTDEYRGYIGLKKHPL
jgi:transposase-like protein